MDIESSPQQSQFTESHYDQDMDWDEDFALVTDEDFRKVWKYEAKRTTVVRLNAEDKVRLLHITANATDCRHRYHI